MTQDSSLKTQDVFIWTDVGTNPDDMLAMLMVLRSPELNIAGVCTNDDPKDFRAQLLKVIFQFEGKPSIPVGAGNNNLSKGMSKREYLGPKFPFREDFLKGEELFKTVLEKNLNVTVITLGTLSDFAFSLKQNPNLIQKIDLWIAMGGALDDEEYNFCSDPEATQFILKQPFQKRIIPLDLTRQFFLEESDFKRIRFPAVLKDYFINQWREWKNYAQRDQLFLNDPLAVACAIGLDSLSYKKGNLILDQREGVWRTIYVDDSKSNLEIAVGVDRGSFFELFYGLLG